MSLLFWGMTLSVVGKGMLALGIIWVHVTMANERRIDDRVIKSFRSELYLTVLGFLLIVTGYFLEIQALGGFSDLMKCHDAECALVETTISQ